MTSLLNVNSALPPGEYLLRGLLDAWESSISLDCTRYDRSDGNTIVPKYAHVVQTFVMSSCKAKHTPQPRVYVCLGGPPSFLSRILASVLRIGKV
jgi:hypothetical protein